MKGLQGFEPAPQTEPVDSVPCRANWSDPSFFQITNRFDRTHARPERNSGVTVRILMVVIEAITRWPSRCPAKGQKRKSRRCGGMSALPR
jgi:hypothetical protein